MPQLYEGKTHRCQIDCSNHDQVLNALQMKSKDLYYFWRNYEWLYNHYYNQSHHLVETEKSKENHDSYQRQIENLEEQNDKLIRQNKKLKMELETIRKQFSDQQSYHKLEATYKQELSIERNKLSQYAQINQKLISENKKLKNTLNSQEEEHQSQRAKMIKQNKKALQTILQLQQSLDQLRAKPSIAPSIMQPIVQQSLSYAQIQEFSRKQITVVNSRLRNLSAEAEKIVSIQFECVWRQLSQRLSELFGELSQRELQTVIVNVQ